MLFFIHHFVIIGLSEIRKVADLFSSHTILTEHVDISPPKKEES